MSEPRREQAATAGVGYSLVGAGAMVRSTGIEGAHHDLKLTRRTKPPMLAVLRSHRARTPGHRFNTGRWAIGTAMVTAGAPAAAKGTWNLLPHRSDMKKADQQRQSWVSEGVRGTGEAWRDKAQGFKSGAPVKVRAVPVAVGAGGAGAGSLAAHRWLDRVEHKRKIKISPHTRSAVTALAAVPAVVASLPISRRLVRRRGYDAQASGGLRPMTKADQYRYPDYAGRHVSPTMQRAKTLTAGAPPVVGPITQARLAAGYAPPHQGRKAAARQVAGGPVSAAAGGTAGAYAAAHLAAHSPWAARQTHRAAQAGADATARVRRSVGMKGEAKQVTGAVSEMPRVLRRLGATKVGRPLLANPERAIGAVVGWHLGHAVAGQVGTNTAISRNLAAQRRYDDHHPAMTGRKPIEKLLAVDPGQERKLARRKRRSAVMSDVAGTAGLSALGLQVASRRPQVHPLEAARLLSHRDTALTVAAGIGGANALTNAAIQRREAKQVAQSMAKAAWRHTDTVAKAQRLDTSMTDEEAHNLVHGHTGYKLTGPLPSHLGRDERMKAYEARYLAAGGRKSQKWGQRARHAETARNVGLAGATAAGAAWLGAGSPRVRALARATSVGRSVGRGLSHPRVQHTAERAAVASGTLGGAAELYEEHARRKRGSYASAPAGVAASALSRMRAYSS